MALIISSLALIIALVGVWLATTSIKKVEAIGDLILQRVREEQRRTSDEVNAKIEKLEKQSLKIAKKLESLTKEKN